MHLVQDASWEISGDCRCYGDIALQDSHVQTIVNILVFRVMRSYLNSSCMCVGSFCFIVPKTQRVLVSVPNVQVSVNVWDVVVDCTRDTSSPPTNPLTLWMWLRLSPDNKSFTSQRAATYFHNLLVPFHLPRGSETPRNLYFTVRRQLSGKSNRFYCFFPKIIANSPRLG